MKTIYRYPIENVGMNIIRTYKNCEVLQAGIDPRGNLSLWVMVDTKEEINDCLKVYVAGTGWDFEPRMETPTYVNTVKQGEYMWHIFYEDNIVELEPELEPELEE